MTHLFLRDAHDRATPAGRAVRLFLRDSVNDISLDRERRTQIRAHQIVLELGSFVEVVEDLLSGKNSHDWHQHQKTCQAMTLRSLRPSTRADPRLQANRPIW